MGSLGLFGRLVLLEGLLDLELGVKGCTCVTLEVIDGFGKFVDLVVFLSDKCLEFVYALITNIQVHAHLCKLTLIRLHNIFQLMLCPFQL